MNIIYQGSFKSTVNKIYLPEENEIKGRNKKNKKGFR